MPSSFRIYDTVAGAEEGSQLFLNGPDGKPTQDWLKIRGADSKVFQQANRRFRKGLLDHLEGKPEGYRMSTDYIEFTQHAQRQLQATLVLEWSFEEPCTPETVLELFTIAPGVAEQVDTEAGKRSRFARSWPVPSEPLQSSSSGSASQSSQEAQPQNAST